MSKAQGNLTEKPVASSLECGQDQDDPLIEYSESGSISDLMWSPGEVIVWIVGRNEVLIRGFNGYVAKLTEGVGSMSREICEKSIHVGDLAKAVAGHHRLCPRSVFSGRCKCDELGRVRLCTCGEVDVSWVGNCTCVHDAMQNLFYAVEDGFTLYGKRPSADDMVRIPVMALAKLEIHYGDYGLQLLREYPEVHMLKSDVIARWPENRSDQKKQNLSLLPHDGEDESGRRPGYDEVLTIFCDRMLASRTKTVRLEEAEAIMRAVNNRIRRDTITKEIRDFYRLIEWSGGKPKNAVFVKERVVTYLKARRAVRVNAARKLKKVSEEE